MRLQTKSCCDVRLITPATGCVFFGEPCINCLRLERIDCADAPVEKTSLSALDVKKSQILSEYFRNAFADKISVFDTSNVIRNDAIPFVVAICSPLYFAWFDDDLRNELKLSLRTVQKSFNNLSEKLQFYHATFDVLSDQHNGDASSRQSAALRIIGKSSGGVEYLSWLAVMRDYRSVIIARLSEARDEVDEIAQALSADAHLAKLNLLSFSSIVEKSFRARLERTLRVFKYLLNGASVSTRQIFVHRDGVGFTYCKLLYVYNFCVTFENLRKSEVLLSDFIETGTLDGPFDAATCLADSRRDVTKVYELIREFYNLVEKGDAVLNDFDRESQSDPFAVTWTEPSLIDRFVKGFVLFVSACSRAARFSSVEKEELATLICEGTGVANVRWNVFDVIEILSAQSSVLQINILVDSYTRMLDLDNQIQTDSPRVREGNDDVDSFSRLLSDSVDRRYRVDESKWVHASLDWPFLSDDHYRFTYAYAVISRNWWLYSSYLRNAVRMYVKQFVRRARLFVVDQNKSPLACSSEFVKGTTENGENVQIEQLPQVPVLPTNIRQDDSLSDILSDVRRAVTMRSASRRDDNVSIRTVSFDSLSNDGRMIVDDIENERMEERDEDAERDESVVIFDRNARELGETLAGVSRERIRKRRYRESLASLPSFYEDSGTDATPPKRLLLSSSSNTTGGDITSSISEE